ncbi:phosphate-starvation-inducible PsiE family protein [Pseudomonas juntendi]|uniref:Protein PsiE n=1 Tax=Pseudomonas juntendi TaxID=2666183 RepID=A0A7W2R063_9PSED|nr:phosphate-starvation-inducible PsiE family protein [Pseudomonas juntendi]MBA6149381.1 phosphate-starvation-inducible PsiE family protein [Pseudomonas juntendi]
MVHPRLWGESTGCQYVRKRHSVKTNHMPIRFLLYVAITALTRLLIGDVSHHKAPDEGLLYLCGGILLLAFSILVVRYASYRYPSTKVLDANGKQVEEGK